MRRSGRGKTESRDTYGEGKRDRKEARIEAAMRKAERRFARDEGK